MLIWHHWVCKLVSAFRLKARKQRVGLKRPNEMKSDSLVSLQLKTLSRCRRCYCRNIIMCQSYEYSRSFIYLWQADTNKSSPATLSRSFLNSVAPRNLACVSLLLLCSIWFCYVQLTPSVCLLWHTVHAFLSFGATYSWRSRMSVKRNDNVSVTFISPSLSVLRPLPRSSTARCPGDTWDSFQFQRPDIIICSVNHSDKAWAESLPFNYHTALSFRC